ncbi:MAG: response regulator [Alphaproteobacteria bacterium]|nr:response regulator [Alphaproteobacteria bacterium]
MPTRLLVIDDDETDRMAIRRYLTRPDLDYEIEEAAMGGEALEILSRENFACVFVDYRLPDMDGIALLRELYDVDTDSMPCPFVMLTGQGSEGVMSDALRWGASDYIIKDNISADTLRIALAKAREVFDLKRTRLQMEEKLRHAQKMDAVGQLTSGIAHDFNNLLTVILGNTRLLERRLAPEKEDIDREDLARKVKAIDSAARRGAELVRHLMVFTRQRELIQNVTDLNAAIEETSKLLKRTLGEMVDVRFTGARGLWPVFVDTSQFDNAVINIAVNARDAMPKGGKFVIETSNIAVDGEYASSHGEIAPGDYVLVSLSDSGTGMPEGVRQRIFEPFYTTKAAGEGTGLGLSMVYGFIQQSGGYVHVQSEEGHGTTFRIFLPRYIAEVQEAAPSLKAKEVAGGTETILVVENDRHDRAAAREILQGMGYRTLEAASGDAALKALSEEKGAIDLVFTDIVMPGKVNGIDLAKAVYNDYPGVKVLFASGYARDAMPENRRVDDRVLIGKPYNKDTLAAKVRQILDERERYHVG